LVFILIPFFFNHIALLGVTITLFYFAVLCLALPLLCLASLGVTIPLPCFALQRLAFAK